MDRAGLVLRLLVVGLAAGCTRTVDIVYDRPPDGKPVYVSNAPAPDPEVRGFVGRLDLKPDVNTSIAGRTVLIRWAPGEREALSSAWEHTLTAQPMLGMARGTGHGMDYTVDVTTSYSSGWHTQAGMTTLAVLGALGLYGAGYGAGYAIDSRSGRAVTASTATVGTTIGAMTGLVAGVLLALALPTEGHDHAWTSEVDVYDSSHRRLHHGLYSTRDTYSTSIFTGTDGRHSSRASTLFRGHLVEVTKSLESQLPPILAAYAVDHAREVAVAKAASAAAAVQAVAPVAPIAPHVAV